MMRFRLDVSVVVTATVVAVRVEGGSAATANKKKKGPLKKGDRSSHQLCACFCLA